MDDQVRTAVGLYTSMQRPWDGVDEAVPERLEQLPETLRRVRLRLFLSSAATAIATWLAGVKSMLPDGWL
jgi:hypothetical protein